MSNLAVDLTAFCGVLRSGHVVFWVTGPSVEAWVTVGSIVHLAVVAGLCKRCGG